MSRITTEHLSREAIIYVRQSTMKQVLANPGSRQWQYGLRDRAGALGWPEPVVIDEDLHALLNLMEDGPFGERALHAPERVLRAREQVIDAPRLLSAEVGAVGLEHVAAVETLGEFTPWLVERIA